MFRQSAILLSAAFLGASALAGTKPATHPSSAPATIPATTPVTTQAALPPAPVPLLSPEDEAKTFNLPAGFRAEVVAAEPMVEHPVFATFDPDGRLWVAEMRGYMPNVAGFGEDKPTGRVSVLEDVDGDGRMDKSTVFLDKLVLPRAIGFVKDGVLIGSPTKLLFCRDTDHDGKADKVDVVATDFGIVSNPENSPNGMLYGLDNWIYNADYEKRIRYVDGKFIFSPIGNLGQWGITRDDFGRLFFDTNSDALRGALVPPHYSARNPKSPVAIADTKVLKDQTVWPAHAATVNRGYRDGFLRDDGRLAAFTAACGPCIYRGDLFPPEFYGNALICEATSNLVHRSVINEKEAILTAKSAYAGWEFIASAYERFRPVNLFTGPEGALYVVDMHHGLIQHRMSITEYAKKEYLRKNLEKHLLTGRIFRIVPEDNARVAHPRLTSATTAQLVTQLTHPNGWWRDTAQRLLVQQNDAAAVPLLNALAAEGKSPLDRLLALWTLEGMDRLTAEQVRAALTDADSKVRANAIRLAEPFVAKGDADGLLTDVLKLANDDSVDVRIQFALSASGLVMPATDAALVGLLAAHGNEQPVREAAISGLAGREMGFLHQLFGDPAWASATSGRSAVITAVARSVVRRDEPREVLRLVEFIGEQPANRQWQQLAMLEAVPSATRDAFGASKAIEVASKPQVIEMLDASSDEKVRKSAVKVAALFQWPGKPMPPRPKVIPLTEGQQKLFEVGRVQYATICAQCHRPDGSGQEGKAPPLLNSPWVLGPDTRLIRILLHGLRGPLTVGDHQFNMDMPALGALSDEQIAGVLTYVRREWGHEAPAVEPSAVQQIRDWNQARRDGWTESELLSIR